ATQELFGIPAALLDDDRLGRGLERFAPHAEAVRGALAARAIERFGVDAGRLHVDLTAIRMTGAYEDSALVAKGWAQGQGVDRQVRALQASSQDGVSLYLRPDPGNAAELTLIAGALERLRALADSNGGGPALVVCDSAAGQPKTLCQIARAGLRFIAPLKASTGWRERYLDGVGAPALRLVGPVKDLIEVNTATRKGRPTISWQRREEQIAEAARADGVYALATNLADRRLGANAILHRYKGQQIVERRHRDLKQTLRVRPIFLHKDERIHALVSI